MRGAAFRTWARNVKGWAKGIAAPAADGDGAAGQGSACHAHLGVLGAVVKEALGNGRGLCLGLGAAAFGVEEPWDGRCGRVRVCVRENRRQAGGGRSTVTPRRMRVWGRWGKGDAPAGRPALVAAGFDCAAAEETGALERRGAA